METVSVTDYVQNLHDIIPAIQLGVLPQGIGTVYHVIAANDDIGTTPKILSSNENTNPFNETGKTLYLSSASATDTQQIYIEGTLYSDGSIAGEYVNLNGQTAVQLSNLYHTILRAYNNNGSAMTADAYVGSEALPTIGIPAYSNMYAHIPHLYDGKIVDATLNSTFTVPKDYTAFVLNWFTTSGKLKDLELIAYARTPGGIFRFRELLTVYQASYQKELNWMRFEQLTDFKVEALTSLASTSGIATFDVLLLHNDYISKIRPLAWR